MNKKENVNNTDNPKIINIYLGNLVSYILFFLLFVFIVGINIGSRNKSNDAKANNVITNSINTTVENIIESTINATTEDISETVYITFTGTKYHINGCFYLRNSKIPITKSDAITRGYTPCKICKP